MNAIQKQKGYKETKIKWNINGEYDNDWYVIAERAVIIHL